ncbi:MAG: hypothetical protein EAZ89_14700 [Bacteroidetes bacterium]|nr:MAG: hypothetical protein EAZ89_14700 [Bacteroidota bacterium]
MHITFERFPTESDAAELIGWLEANEIPFITEAESSGLDDTFTPGGELSRSFVVKLLPEDFEKARELLAEDAEEEVATEPDPTDHYLHEFTDEELLEVLHKPDEWTPYDYALAHKLLKERGTEVSEAELETFRQARMAQLVQPEKDNPGWIVMGYVIALLVPLIGPLLGWYMITLRKTLPDGKRVFAYSAATRKQGERIFVLGLVVSVLAAIWLIYQIARGF